MDLNKLAFEAFCSSDAEYKTKIKELVKMLMDQGKTELVAIRQIRCAASDYYSYKATQLEKDCYIRLRGERCFYALYHNDRELEQTLLATYGLFCSDIVMYARNYYHMIKNDFPIAKFNFEVAARKFTDASKKHANAPKEDENSYVSFARTIAYSKFKTLAGVTKKMKLTDAYFTKMVEYLKEHRPEIYDLLMSNIKASNLINSTNEEDIEERLDFVTNIRNKIVLNKGYSTIEFYKDTYGLSVNRFYQMYRMHYTPQLDPAFSKVAKFLGRIEEEDKVLSPNEDVYQMITLSDGTQIKKGATFEERQQVLNYLKKMGWPITTSAYISGIKMIIDNPEFFAEEKYIRNF